MTVSQCGHVREAPAGFGALDNSTSIDFLSGVFFAGVFFVAVYASKVVFSAVVSPAAALSAVFANTINLKRVASGHVTVLAADLLLDFSYLGREEFDRGAALGTHHVVMAAPVVLMLVAGDAVMKGDFAGKPATGQKLQRAVDGGETDTLVFFLDQAVQFVGGEMFASFEERAQNRAALSGLLQAYAAQMLQENRLGFADVLARNAGLIVDSLLKHGGTPADLRRKVLIPQLET